MTGVIVSKINPLSDAYKILKKDDIILSFDGVLLANDGTGVFFLLFTEFSFIHILLYRLSSRSFNQHLSTQHTQSK